MDRDAAGPPSGKPISGRTAVWLLIGATLVVVGAMIGGVAYSLFGPDMPPVISPATTIVTSALRDDGWPDYEQWLRQRWRKGVTPENNGAVPFWRAMWGLYELTDPVDQALVAKEIGLDKVAAEDRFPLPETSRDESLAKWLAERDGEQVDDWQGGELLAQVITLSQQQPWSRRKLPPIAAWIDASDRAYENLRRAGAAKRFYLSSQTLLDEERDPLSEVALPGTQACRSATRLLCQRAMLALGEGEPSDAWLDLRAAYQLADHLGGGEFTVDFLVGNAIAYETNRCLLHLLVGDALDPDLLSEINQFFASRPTPAAGAAAWATESELMLVSNTAALATNNARITPPGRVGLRGSRLDWNVVLEEIGRVRKALRAFANAESLADRQATQQKLETIYADIRLALETPPTWIHIVSTRDRSLRQAWSIVNEILIDGNFAEWGSRRQELAHRAVDERRLMLVAIEATRRRLATGAYPEALDIEGVRYRPTDDGFLVWTDGLNGTNDGACRASVYRWNNFQPAMHEGLEIEIGSGSWSQADGSPRTFLAKDPTQQPLLNAIPAGADDVALRMPPPVEPWPWERPATATEETP